MNIIQLEKINIRDLHSVFSVVTPRGVTMKRTAGKYDRLFYVSGKGSRQTFADSSSWQLCDGDVVFIPRDAAYTDTYPPDADGFSIIAAIDTNLGSDSMCKWPMKDAAEAAHMWESLLGSFERKKNGWYYACMRTLYAILTRVLRTHLAAYSGSAATAAVAPAVDILNARFTDPALTIPAVAAECGVSYSHFRKLFYDLVGASAKNYLMRLRMENAERLLAAGDLPISAVALKSGYTDEYYFSSAFKKYTGISPSRYREEQFNL